MLAVAPETFMLVSHKQLTITMLKLTEIFGVALTLLICSSELLQAMPYPPELPSTPIYYKRFHRVRPSNKKDIDIYEFRELYYVRRTTPKPKIQTISDTDMDQLIRCDFDPTLPECRKITTTPRSSSTHSLTPSKEATSSSTSTTSTTIGTTSTTIGTTSTTTSSTTSTTIGTTTTTDIPLLPDLPTPEEFDDEIGPTETTTTTDSDDDDYEINPFDDKSDYDGEDAENNDDDIRETEEFLNGGSIGGNDVSK